MLIFTRIELSINCVFHTGDKVVSTPPLQQLTTELCCLAICWGKQKCIRALAVNEIIICDI